MRILNRPMFRYGGPIKEGIMNGMKDNKQAINTVGSPLAPKDETGRGGYAIPLLAAAGMGLSTLGRLAIRPLVRYGANVLRRVPTTGKGGQRLLPKPGEGPYSPVMQVFDPNKPVPTALGKYLMRSPEGRFVMGGAGFAGKAGKKGISAAKYLASSPLTLASGAYYGGSSLYDYMKGDEPPAVGGATELPGGTPRDRGMGIEGKTGMKGPEVEKDMSIDQDKLNQMNKDRIQATKDRYYKLMGIDKMNKEAVYDSLIDASKIISEEGADLKGALKSGTLQSRIIGAISGQLDKSKALKRQIDAAVLKGEIEKDISGAKPGSYLKQAQDYAAMKNISVDQAYKELGFNKQGDLMEDIRDYNTKQGTLPSGNQLAGLARGRGINVTSVADTTEVKNWMNENKGKDEIDFLEAVVATGGAENGAYIVNDRILVIQDGKVKPYL